MRKILYAGALALVLTGCASGPEQGRPLKLSANPSALVAADIAMAHLDCVARKCRAQCRHVHAGSGGRGRLA
jgi:hypothetical protein